jgi:hypothetical protein
MKQRHFTNRRSIAAWGLVLALTCAFAGCSAYDPQAAAQQAAPSYYNQPYSDLSASQKMQLEDHLANQSNQAWRTTAQVTSSVGHLAQGTGILLWAVRH